MTAVWWPAGCWCCSGIVGRVAGPVFAWYTAPLSGSVIGLCKSCTDLWLDNADDDPELEPAELVLVGREAGE